jgi:hypothetical protein
VGPDRYPTTSRAALVSVSSQFRGLTKGEVISATERETASALRKVKAGQNAAKRALKTLQYKSSKMAYKQAVNLLSEEDAAEWDRRLNDSTKGPMIEYHGFAYSLWGFIEDELLINYRDRRLELENCPLIREQSLGEAVMETPSRHWSVTRCIWTANLSERSQHF